MSVIKKRITDVFSDLKENIERKEQEMLQDADEFIEGNTKQIDDLLRLANGMAMNLSELTGSLEDVIENYDQSAACDYYAKHYQQIRDASKTDLPQLQQISSQTQTKFLISARNINEILEGLQNFKLDIDSLHLEMQGSNPAKRSTAQHEERGKNSGSQGPTSVFEMGYKEFSNLKTSVAKTMNKIMQNSEKQPQNQHPYYNLKAKKGAEFKQPQQQHEYIDERNYEEEDEHDYDFMRR